MASASQTKRRSIGGALIQPDMNANPVKKISCHAKGLKNQPRADRSSAGRLKRVIVTASHRPTTKSATNPK